MQIAKWGNSLAVRLPKRLIDSLGLKPGDRMEIVDVSPDRLAVEKVDARAKAIDRMAARRWASPPDFRFDRDNDNTR
jgi:antitoxin MazE